MPNLYEPLVADAQAATDANPHAKAETFAQVLVDGLIELRGMRAEPATNTLRLSPGDVEAIGKLAGALKPEQSALLVTAARVLNPDLVLMFAALKMSLEHMTLPVLDSASTRVAIAALVAHELDLPVR